METVSIRQAKIHLSRLVERAARGEPFVIAKAGKPLVKVVPPSTRAAGGTRRIGFMMGQMTIPADFDRMDEDAVTDLLEGTS
jgi:prevent-host-death family protein